jgi:hypothetical protein
MAKAKRKPRERLEETEAPAPERQYGARASKAKMCATCKHSYLKPCTTPTMIAACPNARFLASLSKKRAPSSKA